MRKTKCNTKLTVQERKRGRRCRTPVAAFGELVWYKPMDKAREKNKIEAKWEKDCGWEPQERPTRLS